jgi:hypothetical protein
MCFNFAHLTTIGKETKPIKKQNMKFRKLLSVAVLAASSLISTSLFAGDITYNLFTGNENRVSATAFEFDVYIQSTGTEAFKLRNVQNTYTFNPAFINGANVRVSYVPNSSAIPSYTSTLKWSNSGNGFVSTANVAGTCATSGIVVPVAPAYVKVGTYRLTALSGQFGTVGANISFVKPGQSNPSNDLKLKAAVSRWDDMNCVKGTATAVVFKEAASATGLTEKGSSVMAPTLFPNPANGKTTLSFNAVKSDKYIVKIFDATGHLVADDAIAAAQGYNSKEINLQGKAAGRYTLSIQTDDTDKESLQLIIE